MLARLIAANIAKLPELLLSRVESETEVLCARKSRRRRLATHASVGPLVPAG
jgi:hypothetical protein